MSYYPPPQGQGQPPVGFYPPPNQQGYPPSNQPGYPPSNQPGYPPAPAYNQAVPYGYPQPGPYPPPGQQMTGPYAPVYDAHHQPGQQGYGHGAPPITQQPTQDVWPSSPQYLPSCLPGIGCLMSVSSLFVKQKVELLEVFTGFETENKYTIKNQLGEKIYFAAEESDCCTRNCCGPVRPFDMRVLDAWRNEIIHLHRPLACDSCWFPCCLQKMEVYSPPGTLVGTVEQKWSVFCPRFAIKDAVGGTVLRIEGPFCTFSLCGPVDFKVLSKDGQFEVGKISKQWSGFAREFFTDADFFGISFPLDLDVRMKAVMLGACFLIDYMFFEKSGNRERDRPGMW